MQKQNEKPDYVPDRQPQTTVYTVIKVIVLTALWIGAFRSELKMFFGTAISSSQAVHAMAIPFAIAAIIYIRWDLFIRNCSTGSTWGIFLTATGIILYAVTIWPFDFGYFNNLAIIPVLAGIILSVTGWRTTKLSLPILILICLAVPLGARIYSTLIIKPETITISTTASILNSIPGLDVSLDGTDIIFKIANKTGAIALGQSNRGARLLLAYATIGTFVTFSQIRPFARLFSIAVIGIPIILLCNWFRFFVWALVDIYISTDPTNTAGLYISTIASLLVAYGLFLLACNLKINLFIQTEKDNNTEFYR